MEITMYSKKLSQKLLADHIRNSTPSKRVKPRTVWDSLKWYESLLIHTFTAGVLALAIILLFI